MVSVFGLVDIPLWLYGAGIFLASLIAAEIVVALLDSFVMPLISRTKTKLDDFLFAHLRGPLKLFFAIFGAYFGLAAAFPSGLLFGKTWDELLVLAFIAASSHALAKTADAITKWYSSELSADSRIKKRLAVSQDIFPMARKLVKIAIYISGAIIILDRLGVQIAPLIAGLGIAGLAVALALQDLLRQFFAGIYLLAEKPIKNGDIISLDNENSSMHGEVKEIGWRMTRIRSENGYDLLVPNDKVAQSIIVNYSSPENSIAVHVGVGYGSDLKKAEKTLLEVAQKVLARHSNGTAASKPIVRVNNFLDSAIELTVVLSAKELEDHHLAESELRAGIIKAFRAKGIEIPFPIRTIHLKK